MSDKQSEILRRWHGAGKRLAGYEMTDEGLLKIVIFDYEPEFNKKTPPAYFTFYDAAGQVVKSGYYPKVFIQNKKAI